MRAQIEYLRSFEFERIERKSSRCKLRKTSVHRKIVQIHVVACEVCRNVCAGGGHRIVDRLYFRKLSGYDQRGEPYRAERDYHGAKSRKSAGGAGAAAQIVLFVDFCAPFGGGLFLSLNLSSFIVEQLFRKRGIAL